MSVVKLGYNFGDCEIREILFDHPDVLIIIYDPYAERDVHLKAFEVKEFLCSTNHAQNVIDAIYEFDVSDFPHQSRQYPFVNSSQTIFSKSLRAHPNTKILHAHGIAGGDLLCQATRIEMALTKLKVPIGDGEMPGT